jgi:hypothetical protein
MQPLEPYVLELLLASVVVNLLLFLIVFGALARVARQGEAIRQLLRTGAGESLEALIRESLEKLDRNTHRLDELAEQLQRTAANQKLCLQKTGMVRYDAYDDVHGKQSFSVALLNAYDTGVVITGLFGRTDARCYGKPIVNGKSEYQLSDEEKQAVQVAMHRVEVPKPE